jgi:hypothetical protein
MASYTMARQERTFVRWQSIILNQLGYAGGLLLTFSAAAALGFALATVKGNSYRAWNRLCGFRKTKNITREREIWTERGLANPEIDERLREQRDEVKLIGVRTWRLFYLQSSTFAVGVGSLLLACAVKYHAKLF